MGTARAVSGQLGLLVLSLISISKFLMLEDIVVLLFSTTPTGCHSE